MSEIHFDEQVDITDVVCPVTFVKAKVALEEMDEGQVLAVKMNDGASTECSKKYQRRRTSDLKIRYKR